MGRPRISLATLALAGCALVGGVACSGSGGSTSESTRESTIGATSAPTDASSTLAPNPDAPAALQFSAPAVGGGTIDFTQYAGQTLALWFWAPT